MSVLPTQQLSAHINPLLDTREVTSVVGESSIRLHHGQRELGTLGKDQLPAFLCDEDSCERLKNIEMQEAID